jgi:hypothetical protein
MPRVGFVPTIPGFERAKTVHALNLADTVIGKHAEVALRVVRVEAPIYSR